MPFVLNASSQEVQVKIHGAWFTFKPKQMKEMSAEKVFHLTSRCYDQGFVALSESFSDVDFRSTAEGKEELKAAEVQGIENRVRFLEQLRQNEVVSLQRDLDIKGLKYDARIEMNKEVISQLQELASYKTGAKKQVEDQVAKIKEIEALLEE